MAKRNRWRTKQQRGKEDVSVQHDGKVEIRAYRRTSDWPSRLVFVWSRDRFRFGTLDRLLRIWERLQILAVLLG